MKLLASAVSVALLAGCMVGEPDANDLNQPALGVVLPSGNCMLVVPDKPLSAQGLATPYWLTSAKGTRCQEAGATSAFVQAAVFSPSQHTIAIYNPLVVDIGIVPATAPVVPSLPADAVVAIWFGYNADTLTLRGSLPTTLADGHCVGGLSNDPFGQVAFCNASQFFAAVNAVGAANLVPPPPALGTAVDGLPCPTVRNYFNVDQDPSDNVTSTYLVTTTGKLAQNTAANRAAFPGSTVISNASDNKLLANKLDGVLGCAPYKAPDLADPGAMVTAQPLNEIMAAVAQASPSALVPELDPMVLTSGAPNLTKLNLYRAGVDQPAEPSLSQAASDQLAFCQNMLSIAPARLKLNQARFTASSSPDPAAGNNLFTFMAQRFNASWSILTCDTLTGSPSPITATFDASGVCTGASIN